MALLLTLDNTSGGIEGLFNRTTNFAVFERISAAGQPGAIALPDDGRKDDDCAIAVGLAKDILLHVSVRIGIIGGAPADRSNPCPRANKVAELAIATLTAG
ncbi:hypothetical protein JOF53_002213 [Crossiella equi]|uniref:Uncharacterized protein n=1 Tax=Crossiella equi TaxID=130796 RepID=A0ABS5A9T6_9PSEU|nr:DUF3558 family protein [Crossiella equi]MBP2473341.1 hypothetical protein [Crossiella equi]